MRTLNCNIGENLSTEEILEALSFEFEDKLGDFLIYAPFFRAEYEDDSFSLDKVETTVKDGWFDLCYSFDWFIPSGCKDGWDSDTEMREIRFQYKNGVAKFEIEDGDARTTMEEF